MFVTVTQFNQLVKEHAFRLGFSDSLIGQIRAVTETVRRVCPEGELHVMLDPFEYFRLETRAGGRGGYRVPGFEMIGQPQTLKGSLWDRMIQSEYIRNQDLNARFYPDIAED